MPDASCVSVQNFELFDLFIGCKIALSDLYVMDFVSCWKGTFTAATQYSSVLHIRNNVFNLRSDVFLIK